MKLKRLGGGEAQLCVSGCVCVYVGGREAEGKVRGNANRRRKGKNIGGLYNCGGRLGNDKACVALFRLVGHKFQQRGGVGSGGGRMERHAGVRLFD